MKKYKAKWMLEKLEPTEVNQFIDFCDMLGYDVLPLTRIMNYFHSSYSSKMCVYHNKHGEIRISAEYAVLRLLGCKTTVIFKDYEDFMNRHMKKT
jgi:hypothetical protein